MTEPTTATAIGAEPLPFQYVVLRCVPRVEREEFVNVGVLLYCQAADYLCSASRISEARLRALAPELDLAAVGSALAAIEAVCGADFEQGGTAGGGPARISLGQRFGWLTAPRSTVLQPGPIHGGLTTDPSAELARLLDLLV